MQINDMKRHKASALGNRQIHDLAKLQISQSIFLNMHSHHSRMRWDDLYKKTRTLWETHERRTASSLTEKQSRDELGRYYQIMRTTRKIIHTGLYPSTSRIYSDMQKIFMQKTERGCSTSANSTSASWPKSNWPKSNLAEVEFGRSRNWPKSKQVEQMIL